MARRMPNASLAQATWGGMEAPKKVVKEIKGQVPLKQYHLEQVLYFHERRLKAVEEHISKSTQSKAPLGVMSKMDEYERRLTYLQEKLQALEQHEDEDEDDNVELEIADE